MRRVVLALAACVLIAPARADAFGLGASPLPPTSPPAPTAAPTGSYKVGIRVQSFNFRGHELTLQWWYPAKPAAGAPVYITEGGIKGIAVRNAPLDRGGGKYPLIVFSPGLGAPGDGYYFYTQNLASHGYVVVSITGVDATRAARGAHPEELAQVAADRANGNGSDAVLLTYANWFRKTQLGLSYRPAEAGFALDTAVAAARDRGSKFYGAIDTARIGMTGHSLGGATTLFLGGQSVPCDIPLSATALNPNATLLSDVNACAFPVVKRLTSPTGFRDPRIKAMLPLAEPPILRGTQLSLGASTIRIPTMFITGDSPQLEATLPTQRTQYRAARGSKYFVEVKNTTHLLVSDAFGLNAVIQAATPPEDNADFTAKARVYEDYSAAFFDRYLKGRKSAGRVLHQRSSRFVAQLEYKEK